MQIDLSHGHFVKLLISTLNEFGNPQPTLYSAGLSTAGCLPSVSDPTAMPPGTIAAQHQRQIPPGRTMYGSTPEAIQHSTHHIRAKRTLGQRWGDSGPPSATAARCRHSAGVWGNSSARLSRCSCDLAPQAEIYSYLNQNGSFLGHNLRGRLAPPVSLVGVIA